MSPPSNPWSHTAAWDRWLAPDWTAGSQSANRSPPTTSPRSACRSHSDGHSMKPTSRVRWSFSVTPRGVGTSGPIPGSSAGSWRSATDDERSSGLPRRGSPGCFEGSRQNSGSHSTTPAGSRPTTADAGCRLGGALPAVSALECRSLLCTHAAVGGVHSPRRVKGPCPIWSRRRPRGRAAPAVGLRGQRRASRARARGRWPARGRTLAVGANRWRIIRPLLAEGILLTGVAAAIALLLTAGRCSARSVCRGCRPPSIFT